MAENKDLKPSIAQNELDENENPSSLNISLSNSTVSDSFKMINTESDKKCSEVESLNSTDDTLISAGLSTSQKNALVDSGFHCENLEKIAPELINNSLCESVDNELDNGLSEEKQVSCTSGISEKDNSLNTSKDTSFNTIASTTSTNISLLFERLTLNSEGNIQTTEVSASPEFRASSEILSNQSIPLDDNFKHTDLLNVDVNSNGSNAKTPNISVSLDNVHQPPLPDLNIESKVPLNETFDTANSVDVSMNTNVDTNTSEITNSPIFPETSLDDAFKCPLPVPESSNVPNNLNTPHDNVFPVEHDDSLDGEEFQDAVQFFKDPSSFQILENIKTSDVSVMPRDSLYVTFDPLYKRVIQPTDGESVDIKENADFNKVSIKEETCDLNDIHLINKQARESLGINLVSFDSPIKINLEGNFKENNLNKESGKEVCSTGDDNDNLLNRQATSITDPESLGIKLELDLVIQCSIDTNSEKDNEDLTKESLKGEISNIENIQRLVSKHARESFGTIPVSIQPPINYNPDNNSVKENIDSEIDKLVSDGPAESGSPASKLESDLPLKCNSDSEKDSEDLSKEILEQNQQMVNKILKRESLSDNLLSFESPIKSNFENVKTSSLEIEQRLYTEEEFQQALKIYELTLQEAYLKKQKELETTASKQGRDIEDKLNQVTKLCKILLITVAELESVASKQNIKIGELSSVAKNLESENRELSSNLKTSTEDLQSVENTFSDFHKRYVQCKDMLKTYKDNEVQLKIHIENLSKKVEELEQANAMLQVKMEEMVDKVSAEVASARKGGDAQLAVLKAQLKKSELKVSSLENDLKQTRIENDKLSGICDDLMAKVSEA